MTTPITHYSMQDFTSPYADIERLPHLTAEVEPALIHDLRFAQQAPAAKQRLIEGYLPRVLTLVRHYDRQYRVVTFDDLVQEGSLALIGAIDKCASMPITKSLPQARLTVHYADPITGNEDTLYSLFYEFYRGYTIYSRPDGRCCIHGKQGCIKLRGKFVCFPDLENAKRLIKRLRREGYTSSDSVERYLPEWEFVCLNRREHQRSSMPSRPMQRIP